MVQRNTRFNNDPSRNKQLATSQTFQVGGRSPLQPTKQHVNVDMQTLLNQPLKLANQQQISNMNSMPSPLLNYVANTPTDQKKTSTIEINTLSGFKKLIQNSDQRLENPAKSINIEIAEKISPARKISPLRSVSRNSKAQMALKKKQSLGTEEKQVDNLEYITRLLAGQSPRINEIEKRRTSQQYDIKNLFSQKSNKTRPMFQSPSKSVQSAGTVGLPLTQTLKQLVHTNTGYIVRTSPSGTLSKGLCQSSVIEQKYAQGEYYRDKKRSMQNVTDSSDAAKAIQGRIISLKRQEDKALKRMVTLSRVQSAIQHTKDIKTATNSNKEQLKIEQQVKFAQKKAKTAIIREQVKNANESNKFNTEVEAKQRWLERQKEKASIQQAITQQRQFEFYLNKQRSTALKIDLETGQSRSSVTLLQSKIKKMQSAKNQEISYATNQVAYNTQIIESLELQEKQALDQLQRTQRTEKAYTSKFEKGMSPSMKKTLLSANEIKTNNDLTVKTPKYIPESPTKGYFQRSIKPASFDKLTKAENPRKSKRQSNDLDFQEQSQLDGQQVSNKSPISKKSARRKSKKSPKKTQKTSKPLISPKIIHVSNSLGKTTKSVTSFTNTNSTKQNILESRYNNIRMTPIQQSLPQTQKKTQDKPYGYKNQLPQTQEKKESRSFIKSKSTNQIN